jgi:hypothetical protein
MTVKKSATNRFRCFFLLKIKEKKETREALEIKGRPEGLHELIGEPRTFLRIPVSPGLLLKIVFRKSRTLVPSIV